MPVEPHLLSILLSLSAAGQDQQGVNLAASPSGALVMAIGIARGVSERPLLIDARLGRRAASPHEIEWMGHSGGTAGRMVASDENNHREALTFLQRGMRLEPAEGRLALVLRAINLLEGGKLRSGWSGRIEGSPSERLRLFAGGASYPGTDTGTAKRVRSSFLAAELGLAGKVRLRVSAERERRIDTFSRTGLALGLRWRTAL